MDGIPAKSVVWLIKNGEDLFICQTKFLQGPKVVQIQSPITERLQLSQELTYQIIHDSQSQIKLLLNRTYKNLGDEISRALNLEYMGKVGLAKRKEALQEQGKKGISRLLNVFNAGQIVENKRAILED